jgi:hypothetical protein
LQYAVMVQVLLVLAMGYILFEVNLRYSELKRRNMSANSVHAEGFNKKAERVGALVVFIVVVSFMITAFSFR